MYTHKEMLPALNTCKLMTAGVFTDATRATDQRTLGSVSDFSDGEYSTSSYPI